MRTLTLTAAVMLLTLSSCKKDFVCECKSNGTVIGKSTIRTTQKNATGVCSDQSAQYQQSYPGSTCGLR